MGGTFEDMDSEEFGEDYWLEFLNTGDIEETVDGENGSGLS